MFREFRVFVLLLAVLLCAFLPGAVSATQCGNNVSWSLEGGVLTLSGSGPMTDFGWSAAPWNKYSADITAVVIADGITSIGNNAFAYCTSLQSITLPNSVTAIGSSAFSGCTDLQTVSIPDSVQEIGSAAFSDCVSLRNVTIPGSVATLGNSVFSNCARLTFVALGNGVQSIGSYCFYECGALMELTLPDSLCTVENDAFAGCVKLTYAYYGNGKYLGTGTNPYLILVTANDERITICKIRESTKIIAGGAFANTESLTDVHYDGTRAQWEAMTISHNNDYLEQATIQCLAEPIPGDLDNNRVVNTEDAIALLLHVSMPNLFPLNTPADFDGDNAISTLDVIQLLLHISMPDTFPLT